RGRARVGGRAVAAAGVGQGRGNAAGRRGPDAAVAGRGLAVAGAVRRAGRRVAVRGLAAGPADLAAPARRLGRAGAGRPLDAGAMAVPADLKEAARSYNITGWRRFRVLYFPALFPYLVTGWVTAAGGAWNASIVAEFGNDSRGNVLVAHGLGADIMEAAAGWR